MAEIGILGGNATVLDWPGNVPDQRGNSRNKRGSLPDLPSGSLAPSRQNIQVFDAAGMDELYYQARAGLQRLIEAAISQNIDPDGIPDPSNPASFRIKSQITQAKEMMSHYGEILAQGKENQQATIEANLQNRGRLGRGYDGGIVSNEVIAEHFIAGNPEKAIQSMNHRMRTAPKTAQEAKQLQELYEDYKESVADWMFQSGYPDASIERAIDMINPPQSYNASIDEYRKAQGQAAKTRAAAQYKKATGSGSGDGPDTTTSLWVNSLAAKIDEVMRNSKGGVFPAGVESHYHPVPGGSVRIFENGDVLLNLTRKLGKEEREELIQTYGEESVKRLESGQGIGFDSDDLGPLIDILTPSATVKKDLQNKYYPRIVDPSSGRVSPQSILNSLNGGSQIESRTLPDGIPVGVANDIFQENE